MSEPERRVPWSIPDTGDDEKQAAIEVINSGWWTQGKKTKQFEEELAAYIGCKHVVMTSNGTAALICSLIAHKIGRGDEVIVPSLTFIASLNTIVAVGAVPVLCDSDKDTWNMTPEQAKKCITNKTKAIMTVDVAGMPVDIDGFQQLCQLNNLVLIADSAEALGAEYKGKKVGSFDHLSIFSFHMAKQVSMIEGGCVCTNNPEMAEKIQLLRNHGMDLSGKKDINYNYVDYGLNFRTTDINAAIGSAQLKKIEQTLEKRKQFADLYKNGLRNATFQGEPEYVTRHPHMFFGVRVDKSKRNELIGYLNEHGVATRVCWLPAHRQHYHKNLFSGSYPGADDVADSVINLPIGNANKIEDVDYVIKIFNQFFEEQRGK